MEKFLERIGKLAKDGKITEDCRERIFEEFKPDLEKSERNKRTVAGIFVFALTAALLAVGAQIFIVDVWHLLGKNTQTAVAFLPLIASVACAVAAVKKNAAIQWREAAAVFNVIGVICAIGVSASIWQVEGSKADFMATVFLLTFPVVAVLGSGIGALCCAIFAAAFALDNSDSFTFCGSFRVWAACGLLISGAFCAAHALRGEKSFYAAAIFAAAVFPASFCNACDFPRFLNFVFLSCAYGAIAAFSTRRNLFVLRPVILACVILLLEVNTATGIFKPEKLSVDWWLIGAGAAALLLWGYEFFRAIRRKSECWATLLISLIAPLGAGVFAAFCASGTSEWLCYASALFSAGIGLAALAVALKKSSNATFWAGFAILVATLITLWLNDGEQFAVWTRSGILIVSGAGVAVVGLRAFKSGFAKIKIGKPEREAEPESGLEKIVRTIENALRKTPAVWGLLAVIFAAQIALPAHSIADIVEKTRNGLTMKFEIKESMFRTRGTYVWVYATVPRTKYTTKLECVEKALGKRKDKNPKNEKIWVYNNGKIPVAFEIGRDGFARVSAYGDAAKDANFKADLRVSFFDPRTGEIEFEHIGKKFNAAQRTLDSFEPDFKKIRDWERHSSEVIDGKVGEREPSLKSKGTFAVLTLTRDGKFVINNLCLFNNFVDSGF